MKKVLLVCVLALVFNLAAGLGSVMSVELTNYGKPRVLKAFIFDSGGPCGPNGTSNGIAMVVELPKPPPHFGHNVTFKHRYYGGCEWGMLWIYQK